MEMTPGRALTTYLLTVPIFLAIDLLWLGVVAKDLYRKHLGYLLSPRINWAAAITFYLVFVAGTVLFAVRPGIEAGSPPRALAYGAVLGFFAYATYDLTNLATIRDWPLLITVVDLIWGTILCGSVAWISCLVSLKLR